MNYGYIYRTLNIYNGKIYIGKHKGEFDPDYLGSGDLIRRAIAKHGTSNFTVDLVAIAYSKEELNKMETEYISAMRKTSLYDIYNIADGGDGGDLISGHPRRKEIVEKIRRACIGRVFSKERRENISKALMGHAVSRKSIEKSRENHLGKRWMRNLEFIEEKLISLRQINDYLSKGWTFGRRKERHRKLHKYDCLCIFCKAKRGENKGKNSPTFGKHWNLSELTKSKMRKHRSFEHRENISRAKIGKLLKRSL